MVKTSPRSQHYALSEHQMRKRIAFARSNFKLLQVSGKASPEELAQARSELTLLLETGIQPSHCSEIWLFERHGLTPDKTYEQRRKALGLTAKFLPRTRYQDKLDARMANEAQATREASWKWRCGAEMEWSSSQKDWWPIFFTGTIDPKRHDGEAMWREGNELKKFLLRLARLSNKASPDPVPPSKVLTTEHVRYCGQIEHGKSRVHHHLHALLFVRFLPPGLLRCPNRSIRDPMQRTVQDLPLIRSLWEAGMCDARPFRHIADKWRSAGFCYPIVNGKPFEALPPAAAGAYLTKYMNKSDKEWDHRTKSTQGFGLRFIDDALADFDVVTLVALRERPDDFADAVTLATECALPAGLLRSRAERELFRRNFLAGTLDFEDELTPRDMPYSKMALSAEDVDVSRLSSREWHAFISEHLPPSILSPEQVSAARRRLASAFPRLRRNAVKTLGGAALTR